MTYRIAINGYGRIGRNVTRALYERNLTDKIKIVAINDLGSLETLAHLTRYDTTHGKFNCPVNVINDCLEIQGNSIKVFNEADPRKLPWKELNVDLVLECSGHFTTAAKSKAHLDAGSPKVIIGAPADNEVDLTVVYGINHQELKSHHQIISNASCTTNCLAPIVKPLHEELGIINGLMTTIHAYTNDQVLTDVQHKDVRRARSATQSMIPTSTGAAKALDWVFPKLQGKITGYSMRVPTLNVSVVDFTFTTDKPTDKETINQIMRRASETDLAGILAYNEEKLVSIDFNHNPASAIFDATQTLVTDNLIKVVAWYDNEWGFSNRMIDLSLAWLETH